MALKTTAKGNRKPMSLRVSIITACKNNASTLYSCFKSVGGQSLQAEHIVVDGGSTDESRAIIEDFSHNVASFVSETDSGVYDALNKGIALATGDIVGILHADDLFAHNQVLESVVENFEDGTEAVYGDLEYVDREDSLRVKRRWVAGACSVRKFYNGWMPPHPTFFVRRECYERWGGYRLDLGTAADYELMLRFLLIRRASVKYIPRVMVRMRLGGVSNSSLKARLIANRMDKKAWELNGLKPRPWTMLAKPARKLGQWRLR